MCECGQRAPTEEEADEEEAGGQPQSPSAEPAWATPSDKDRVGFVKGIPHLDSGRRGPPGTCA